MKKKKYLKILICSQEYPPDASGIGNLIYNLKYEWEKCGHRVDVCSPNGPEYKIKGALNLIKKFGGIGIAFFWFKAGKIISNNVKNYDLIYLNNPLLFKKFTGKNIRCVVHTLYYSAFVRYVKFSKKIRLYLYYLIMISLEKLSYKYLNNFDLIVTSPETVYELKHYKIDRKLPIIFNGVRITPKLRDIKNNYLLSQKSLKKLIYIGRLDIQKGLFSLLATFKALKYIDNSFILTIVGDGPQKKELVNYIKKNKIEDISIVGYVDPLYISKFYSSHDFLVMASYYEGFPLVLSEALGYGLIPILSPITIFKYIQKVFGEGLIVDFNNPPLASKKIAKFTKEINMKKVVNNIMDKSSQILGWENIAKEYLKLESFLEEDKDLVSDKIST